MSRPLVNVLQLISSLQVGGSEKLLLELLSASRDDDRVNYVVVIMNQGVNPDMQEKLDRMALPTYYLNRPEGHKHPKYLAELKRIIDRHEIDIVHAHNFGSKLWGVLCKMLNPRLKLVFTIHDTFMLPRLDRAQIWIHQKIIDTNIAISRAVAELCEQRGVRNYRQIYNGIPVGRFYNPNRESLQARLSKMPYSEKPLQILHVGRIDPPIKGQDILIEAVRLCRAQGLNVKARLMGGVYAYGEKAFEELKRQVETAGLQKHIEFITNRTDVPAMLAEADLFVLPSRREGLGLVVLEAMAAGVPVIAANIDGPCELVEDGVTGLLFEVGHAPNLANKIGRIYRNAVEADEMRLNALEYVSQFDIHHMKQQYYRLYESLNQPASVLKGWQPAWRGVGNGAV